MGLSNCGVCKDGTGARKGRQTCRYQSRIHFEADVKKQSVNWCDCM